FLAQLSDEVKDLLQLELTTMEPSWLKVLIKEIQKPYFLKLKQFLLDEKKNGKKVFPPEAQIYSWSRFTPLEQVKVVIIGQDPYHNDNQAHGLCFSVNKGIIIPPSLKNIYKEIKNEYPNFVIPKHGYLEAWANQGVLLLNAALTVQAHNANSHAGKGWEMFTDAIINYLNKNNRNLVFILWGSYAQKKGKVVDKNKHLILNGVHPSPLSASRGFFSCNHFQLANEYLKKHNRQEIDWCSIKD
ncbi:uracil-DNA glycosylase, partial [Neoconidiobolus thromboides FSU 785]